ncbi:hypothetical protein BGZ57DRAFT_950758 [Hyaloscypha finlandica]|nr:hypothetical protein BGZ57DRAFT_950758 [Hyaloscypha finlandica]
MAAAPLLDMHPDYYSPQGTVATQFSDDRETVTFGFDNFQAFIGPSALHTDKTKQAVPNSFELELPWAFHFTVLQATPRVGKTGPWQTRKYISGSDTSTDWSQGSTYEKVDTVKSASVIWSFCGVNGILNVNNRIGISTERGAPANAASELSDEDATVHFDQQVNLAWQPCDLNAPSSNVDNITTFSADANFITMEKWTRSMDMIEH